MKVCFVVIISFCLSPGLYAQVTDNFSDGDITANPAWYADTTFTVDSGRLRSNSSRANHKFQIVTGSSTATNAQWELSVNLLFNTSSSNYTDIFLLSDSANLPGKGNGYFVRIGNTSDEISLYRKAGTTITEIIDGADGRTNTPVSRLRIKVIRDAQHRFTLYTDSSGSGYKPEGSIADSTFLSGSYFGITIAQSTSTFFLKHFFDDIYVGPVVYDTTPPMLLKAAASGPVHIDAWFSEALDAVTASDKLNYTIPGIGHPVAAVPDSTGKKTVHLSLPSPLKSPGNYTLEVTGIKDLHNNSSGKQQSGFMFFIPYHGCIVISELLPDESPQVKLPAREFLELHNTSAHDISLGGWTLSDGGEPAIFPDTVIKADSFLIVCAAASAAGYAPFGKVLGLGKFPSLNNDRDELVLRDDQGILIHYVNYSASWYRDNLKKQGGWTLEMIDPRNPCSGSSNWVASADAAGGTPGKTNSRKGSNPDKQKPALLNVYPSASNTLQLRFSETLDSLWLVTKARFHVNKNIGEPLEIRPAGPAFNEVTLLLSDSLQAGEIYTLTVDSVNDCGGNQLPATSLYLGLPADPLPGGLVINELLFNPLGNGFDFAEIYNRSDQVIDLKNLKIADTDDTGGLAGIYDLAPQGLIILPGEYMAFTEDPANLMQHYYSPNPGHIIQLSPMPSLPDNAGCIVLVTAKGDRVDQLVYDHDMHFALLDNEEGVSLERIDPGKPSSDRSNWTSASFSCGYASPAYRNSQYNTAPEAVSRFAASPEVFSPDGDGYQDLLHISYKMDQPGFMANISIYDAAGRLIKRLVKNELLSVEGSLSWDGLRDDNTKAAVGIYIICAEIFNAEGKAHRHKLSCVVGAKL